MRQRGSSEIVPDSLNVFLHIGAHKTATTHFQKLLDRNAERLAAASVRYVGPSTIRPTGLSLRQILGLETGSRPGAALPVLEDLAQGARTVILSEENLLGPMFQGDTAQLFPLYPKADLRVERIVRGLSGCNLRLMLSVREPSSYLVSAYSQAMLRARYGRFVDFVGGAQPEQIQWSNLVRRLSLIKGAQELILWRYEEYGALLPQILGEAIPEGVVAALDHPEGLAHQGLSRTAVAVTQAWAEDEPKDKGLAKRAREAFPVSKAHPGFDPWPDTIKEASRAAYEADIATAAALPGVRLLQPYA
ncbi:hypothetical protein [Pseudoruegeria sp. SHC-113]|uniref:hypothetical protein n=1 Tax=Pseudoruegeria sp. SHC-113 TaxID=2855439 RepID=UPI0021BB433C|nr:hypothetical protein [Pseudoruegeria sp. SHC-113]MCT8159306.1 hypothetical protein [Pseudoruegeria sp. SHC-113]